MIKRDYWSKCLKRVLVATEMKVAEPQLPPIPVVTVRIQANGALAAFQCLFHRPTLDQVFRRDGEQIGIVRVDAESAIKLGETLGMGSRLAI